MPGFTLFAFGYIGGGDAKLFAAVALWLGLHDLAALCAGGVAVGRLADVGAVGAAPMAVARGPGAPGLDHRACMTKSAGIPYGVALAAGAFVLLPHAEIFRLAAVQLETRCVESIRSFLLSNF